MKTSNKLSDHLPLVEDTPSMVANWQSSKEQGDLRTATGPEQALFWAGIVCFSILFFGLIFDSGRIYQRALDTQHPPTLRREVARGE